MHFFNLKFAGWAARRFRKPHEKVDVLVAVEKDVVVAAALWTQIVYHVTNAFSLELWFDFSIGNQADNVFDQLTEHRTDPVWAEYHCALPIFPLFWLRVSVFKRVQFTLKIKTNDYLYCGDGRV